MVTAAEKAKQKAAMLAARRNSTEDEDAKRDDPTVPPRVRRAANIRTKPVRKSIDLPPNDASQLSTWEAETAGMLGVSRVTSADVCRVLIRQLLTDETLARKVRSELRHVFDSK